MMRQGKVETKLVSITLPADWWDAASRLAAQGDLTRSELMRNLLWDALPESERRGLSRPKQRGRPVNPS